ncbi:MAG: porin [Sphingomonadales bacterium]|nr:porin [Sphingomonadales bacterium]
MLCAAFGGCATYTGSCPCKTGDPVAIAKGVTLDPIFDATLRYEGVDQPATDADALTVRLRSGLEIASNGFSFLAEAEGTLALVGDYNDTNPGNGVEPYSVVADPESIELNRIQVQYANKNFGRITIGRQKINLDDQRFVGSVSWRQNEQTFDAVSANITALKPITLEGVYAISQRTIFGSEAGPRAAFDGDMVFLGASADVGPFKLKGFSYLIDYDLSEPVAATSTQTYGGMVSGKIKLGDKASVDLRARYAVQKDYGGNPGNYSVDYIDGSIGTSLAGFTLTAGYENLGSNGAGARFQTPLATLHKFNGFADLFLSTPPQGLEDKYATIGYKIPLLGGISTAVTYHNFDSDKGGISYGDEWDASAAFKLGPLNALIKYANYNADLFGVDTKKLWLQLGYSF